MASLFDALRIDHVVGLYRSYGKPPGGKPYFIPADQPSQLAQGEAVIAALKQSGIELFAEDLGVVPDWVRESLTRLGVPGCRVLRWERDWHAPGSPFLDPGDYPPLSVAMSGTHDTEPVALWWDESPEDDRAALFALPFFVARGLRDPNQPWTPALGDALLELAYRSGSNDLFLPIQDLFGWRDRVNTPGTVGRENWTWCLPWPVDRLLDVGEAAERARFGRALARETGRAPAPDYTSVQPQPGVDTA
jgi:4-alpha-glucanotransferase